MRVDIYHTLKCPNPTHFHGQIPHVCVHREVPPKSSLFLRICALFTGPALVGQEDMVDLSQQDQEVSSGVGN